MSKLPLLSRHLCRYDRPAYFFVARRRDWDQPHRTTPASTIPAMSGNTGACGNNNAPVRKHAPKKNCHFIPRSPDHQPQTSLFLTHTPPDGMENALAIALTAGVSRGAPPTLKRRWVGCGSTPAPSRTRPESPTDSGMGTRAREPVESQPKTYINVVTRSKVYKPVGRREKAREFFSGGA